ncbi:MAG: metallophosphoesterase [Clostridia bacterium]|nr:metallophosphoesterase [Clostridia bacterium]
MRILHIADLHLGVKNGKLPKEKQDALKDEMIENCHYLFSQIGKKYDVILVCGDLFHSKSVPTKLVQSFFAAVSAFGKPVLYVNGNHDEKFIFSEIPENFIVLDENNTCFEFQDFVFYGVEHLQNIDKTKNNVLLVHGNIENTRDSDYIDISPYLELGFEYIALGHVHTVKKYKKGNNIFAYSGSLFSNGFDECGDKGYIEVEINNKVVEKCEFKPLSQRKYAIVSYDLSHDKTTADIADGIKREICKQGISDRDIIRVVLTGSYDELLNKSLSILQDSFSEFFYIEIVDESKMKIDIEQLKSEKLSFKNEFISLVENSDLDGAIKQKVIALGIEALKGEDLSI